MITASILKAWFQDNTSRPFPLRESVIGEATLPYPLIVGMDVGIPSTMMSGEDLNSDYTLYVSNVSITPSSVTVDLSAGDEGVVATATVTMQDLFSADGGQGGFALSPSAVSNADLMGVTGTIYFGPAGIIQAMGGVYTLTSAEGAIDLSCIHPYPDIIRGISINGRVLTNEVTFVEGDNISLAFNDDDELEVTYVPDSLEGISSKAELVSAITSLYGAPILSINGQPPSALGNIDILPDAGEGEDVSCVDITTIDHGISIANTCATPCCDRDTYLDLITQSIGELNARAARLSSYLESVSGNINSLQNELSILRLGIKQQ